jgi:sucrose 6(F)-phosphate phosphorylase
MRLERLIRLRNSHPAFDGDFEVLISGRDRMRLVRHAGDQSCLLEVNLRSFRTSVTLTDARARRDRILL